MTGNEQRELGAEACVLAPASVQVVLVVDDSLMDQRLTGGLLGKIPGFRARYANNGKHALEEISREAPDLVLTDLHMPLMDGLELVEAMRRLYPTIPVVVMTAHGSEELAVKALQRGASSYVPKRNLATDLASTIGNVLNVATGERDYKRVLDCTVSTERRLEFGTDISIVNPLVKHLESSFSRLGICDETGTIQVAVALREALSNAIYRGNLELSSDLRETLDGSYEALASERANRDPYRGRRVRVTIQETRDGVSYVVGDDGPGFDPSSVPDPLSFENIERSSGRGLFLIRTFMDEVHHNAIGNEITMVKRRRG